MKNTEIEQAFFERVDVFMFWLRGLCDSRENVANVDIKMLLYSAFMPLLLTVGATPEDPQQQKEMRDFIQAVLSIPGTHERLRDMAEALRSNI